MRGYYFITDSGLSVAGNISDVKTAVGAGVTVVQYREKDMDTAEMYREAMELRRLCRGRGTLFIVNDRIDIALAVDADGVHLGQDDMPYDVARRILGDDKIIGISAGCMEEALAAEKAGADYIGAGPVFATSTKTDAGKPCGIEFISALRGECGLPVVAIGGINMDNAIEVISAGADMVCAISAVVGSRDVAGEIKKFTRLF